MSTPNPNAYSHEGYQDFRDQDGTEHGSFEVFWYDGDRCSNDHCWIDTEDGEPLPSGWYWWPCFPGCLPESDPIGPFDTSADAYVDAQGD